MSGSDRLRTLTLALGLAVAAAPTGEAGLALPCAELGDGCRVILDPTRERELLLVQEAVNAAIRPASDAEVFGLAEHWAPLEGRGHGDCDDFALTKLHWLTRLGWPRDALRLTLATLPHGEDHLVLTVRTDRGDYVLDNLQPRPVPWAALPYRWLGQEVPGSGAWRAVLDGAPEVDPALPTAAFPPRR